MLSKRIILQRAIAWKGRFYPACLNVNVSITRKLSTDSSGSKGPPSTARGKSDDTHVKSGDAQGKEKGKRILDIDIGSTLDYANQGYHDLEQMLMHRINESNTRRFRVVFLSSILFIIWIIAVFGDKLKKMLKDETADFAKETLTNEVRIHSL